MYYNCLYLKCAELKVDAVIAYRKIFSVIQQHIRFLCRAYGIGKDQFCIICHSHCFVKPYHSLFRLFIDEDAAKAALAPVAEIILAHPDHPILLAGTTAQWGSQDSCVNLSNRRAGAVKDLLVNYFGVPESQLFTAGLGYADDPFVRGQDVDSNGNFVETEGAKNRRVVVLDAESDIARQILGN